MTPMLSGLRFAKISNETLFDKPLTKEEKLESLCLDKNILLPDKYIDILFKQIVPTAQDKFHNKMSSSNNNSSYEMKLSFIQSGIFDSKLNILDSSTDTKRKINKAYCVEGDIIDNSLLDLLRTLLFPILNYFNLDFYINRAVKFGGPISYKSMSDVESDFETLQLYPGDLKLGIIETINVLLKPIREKFASQDAITLIKKAYPTK